MTPGAVWNRSRLRWIKNCVRRRRMEAETEDFRQKSTRYSVQLEDATAEGQMKALEHQIDILQTRNWTLDELEFASLMETEALEVQQRLLHETRANQLQLLENEKVSAQMGRDRDRATLAQVQQERDSLRPTSIQNCSRNMTASFPAASWLSPWWSSSVVPPVK